MMKVVDAELLSEVCYVDAEIHGCSPFWRCLTMMALNLFSLFV